MDIDEKATLTNFAPLVGVSIQSVQTHSARGVMRQGGTIREWLLDYIRHFREQAAGRGGDKQEQLMEAKIEDLQAKTATTRLAYNREISVLVPSADAETALLNWANYAMRETENEVSKLISTIETTHNIEVDEALINEHSHTVRERIINYAAKLGQSLSVSEGDAAT